MESLQFMVSKTILEGGLTLRREEPTDIPPNHFSQSKHLQVKY